MKKFIFPLTVAATILAAAAYQSQAQGANDLALLSSKKTPVTNASTFTEASLSSVKSAKVANRALKDFHQSFNAPVSASWYVTNTGSMIASFPEAGVNTSVYYDEGGRRLYSIKRYQEAQMPKEVRHEVKSRFYDDEIVCIEEVGIDNRNIYLVHVKSDDMSRTVRVENGAAEVIETLYHH